MIEKGDKKGLSDVIANLLLILLVLVSLAIVWVVVSNIISEGASDIDISQLTFDMKIQAAYVSGTDIVVGVNRNAGGGDIIGIKFLFQNETEIVVVRKDIPLQELEQRTFIFNSTEIAGINAGDEVSVAPIYDSSGSEKTGNPTDSRVISGSPPSGGGSVCGNGAIEGSETCDDSNTQSGDGCSASCQIEPPPACNNNNQLDAGEFCDGTNLNGQDCTDFGFTGGTLNCNNCVFDTSQCTSSPGVCPDGNIDPGEECDGTNLGNTCLTLGYSGGTLSCDSSCNYNTTQCTNPAGPSCDGTWNQTDINDGNECDGTPLPNGCTPMCLCEDGFTSSGTGTCSLDPPLNLGTIDDTWVSIFFNSNDLPHDFTVNGYIGTYVNFSGSPELGCFLITFADYIAGEDISYVRLDYSTGYANISQGEGYSIWEAANCGQ